MSFLFALSSGSLLASVITSVLCHSHPLIPLHQSSSSTFTKCFEWEIVHKGGGETEQIQKFYHLFSLSPLHLCSYSSLLWLSVFSLFFFSFSTINLCMCFILLYFFISDCHLMLCDLLLIRLSKKMKHLSRVK